MPDRVAVCIGINYDHFPPGTPGEAATRAGMNALRFAEADARDMAEALQESGYDVVTLLGVEATRDAILDALYAQREKVGDDGLLLVHFSGHGQIDPKDPNTAYLLPVDADPQKPVHRAIPLDDLARRYLGTTRNALTLLDCCHSGYAVGLRGVAVPDDAAREFGRIAQNTFGNVRGRIALTACAGNQLARELDRLKHGAFTHYALEWWCSSPAEDHNSLATYIAQGLEKEDLPPLVSGGVTEGLIRLRSPPRPASDRAWRQAIQPRLARLDERQLRLLCFRLDIDYDALPGVDRAGKTLRLVFDMEAAGRKDELSAAVNAAAARQERDRALAGRLATLDPARLPALCAALDLHYPSLAGPDPAVTIRNLIAEAEWQDAYDDLVAAGEAALAGQAADGDGPATTRIEYAPPPPALAPVIEPVPSQSAPASQTQASAPTPAAIPTPAMRRSPTWLDGLIGGVLGDIGGFLAQFVSMGVLNPYFFDFLAGIFGEICFLLILGIMVGLVFGLIARRLPRALPLWSWGLLFGGLVMLAAGLIVSDFHYVFNFLLTSIIYGAVLGGYVNWRTRRRS